jgi:hypothetical protein
MRKAHQSYMDTLEAERRREADRRAEEERRRRNEVRDPGPWYPRMKFCARPRALVPTSEVLCRNPAPGTHIWSFVQGPGPWYPRLKFCVRSQESLIIDNCTTGFWV